MRREGGRRGKEGWSEGREEGKRGEDEGGREEEREGGREGGKKGISPLFPFPFPSFFPQLHILTISQCSFLGLGRRSHIASSPPTPFLSCLELPELHLSTPCVCVYDWGEGKIVFIGQL